MTNQNFREFVMKLFKNILAPQLDSIAQTNLLSVLNGYDIALFDCESKLNECKKELEVTDKLLVERDRILKACLCPVHGECVPYVLERLSKFNEAIEVINFYASDSGWMDKYGRTGFQAQEFLNKISSKE